MMAWNSTLKPGKPLQRRTPLQQKAPIRRYREEPRRQGLGYQVAQQLGMAPKHQRREPSVFRSRAHRQTVASLPCVRCRRNRRSQAAHLNLLGLGKGRGLKVSDAFVIPLCAPDIGEAGCHHLLDQSGRIPCAESAALQVEWLQQTRATLQQLGHWPDAAEADYQRLAAPYIERCAS